MLEVAEMELRRSLVRWPVKDFATAANRDPNTVGQVLKGRYGPQWGTAECMAAALIAEELRLRDYLLTLHPVAPATATVPA